MFGKKDSTSEGMDRKHQELFSDIWRRAQQAKAEGQPLFACMVPVTPKAATHAMTMKISEINQEYLSPAPLLAEIERLGWRLEHCGYVQSQDGFGAALHSGPVQGHFLFRSV